MFSIHISLCYIGRAIKICAMSSEQAFSRIFLSHHNSFDWMLSYVKKIQMGDAKEVIWLLEHEDIYTAGTSAKENDFKGLKNIKVLKTNRGGQWTWHGPGQRVVYLMLNLKS